MTAEDRHVCEPVTYDEPVGTRWTCPECGLEYESRPGEELDGWLRRLPGVDVSRTFWRPAHVRAPIPEITDEEAQAFADRVNSYRGP